MGGKTAMLFATTYPDLVDKLVVVDIAPKAYARGHDDVFHTLLSLDLSTLRSRQEADAAMAKTMPDLALRQFLLKNLDREDTGSFRWRIALHEIHANYPEMIKELELGQHRFVQPTLFIRGAKSDYIKDSDIPSLKSIFPQAQVTTIPNTGHWVQAEARQEFARAVLNFLVEDDAMTD
jgi:pimeloyl-ACP methyl ester carboxylesterase